MAGAVGALVTFGAAMAAVTSGSGALMQFAPGLSATVAAVAAGIVLAAGAGLGSGSSLLSLRRHMES